MQQLSSRDCDKLLSMTLTMKERFFLRMERREGDGSGGMTEGKERRGREEQLEGSAAPVASSPYWLRERHFKTQGTFLVSLNGAEAKRSHYSLAPLEIPQ